MDNIYHTLEDVYKTLSEPSVTKISKESKKDPFKVLISCLISLRTKDEVTIAASKRLFSVADSPQKLSELEEDEIAKLIYPAGFYKKKAKTLKEISKTIVNKYGGHVPDTIEELLKLKGVGRKTANLVIVEGFNKDGICVDTHVHRICNRLGVVKTKTPEKTEMELRKILPKSYWKKWNEMLVSFGQKICTPISPKCSTCKLYKLCDRISVEKWR
ncbi:endonuclease III [Deferribacter autotrophicus]|uniref:Endonuclease III n=1 Tax=Deferribacter autotrophicus TaxID=500465 RepID=A0A5A8F1U5_9BACT|nr:endonuclease III [Deferribacter autotrophicus]